jgi:hypothetical protein
MDTRPDMITLEDVSALYYSQTLAHSPNARALERDLDPSAGGVWRVWSSNETLNIQSA